LQDEQEYKLQEINKMNDCLLKLKKENQIIIERLKSINNNNEDMSRKCNNLALENKKLEEEIVYTQNKIDSHENWEICGQIKEIESQLITAKNKYHDNLK